MSTAFREPTRVRLAKSEANYGDGEFGDSRVHYALRRGHRALVCGWDGGGRIVDEDCTDPVECVECFDAMTALWLLWHPRSAAALPTDPRNRRRNHDR